MTIEFDDFDSSSDISDYLGWVLETGIWDGRLVSWAEASEFRDEIQERIFKLLFENSDTPTFEHLAAQLAWIGTPAPNQSFLARDIQELDFSKNDLILQAGLKKSLRKFWKKHKKEILIGAVIVAAVTVVVVVSVSTAGTCTGAAVAAGSAALGGICEKGEKEKPQKDHSKITNPVSQVSSSEFPSLQLSDLSPIRMQLTFNETGVVFNEQYTSYANILLNQADPILPQSCHPTEFRAPAHAQSEAALTYRQSPYPQIPSDIPASWNAYSTDFLGLAPLISNNLPEVEEIYIPDASSPDLGSVLKPNPSIPQKKPWIADFLDTIGRAIIDSPDLLNPDVPLPSHELSSRFSTLGKRASWLGLGAINGMNTKKEEAIDHANHLAKFSQGYCVDWIYNQSHGSVVDVLEILTLNFPGFSPNTSELLLASWIAFAEANVDNSNVKFLQFCHSQGAIHVRNALEKAPQEIRDRVIVCAFAPAVHISDDLCFQVDRYACKGDLIPHGEVAYAGFTGGILKGSQVLEAHEQLIWVDPHPDTKNPHDFQNPAFDEIKEREIRNHIRREGVYTK